MGSHDQSSIKEEIKADKFVKSMGYQNDLISVFKLLLKSINFMALLYQTYQQNCKCWQRN